ncbi:MAG: methyltransferase domain-containing protein [Elusimicrobiota bacterium]
MTNKAKSEKPLCYLCGSEKHFKRPGKVRDNGSISVFECGGCGLVYLYPMTHINEEFYSNSEMHGQDHQVAIRHWLNEIEFDDERRYNFCKPFITNKVLLDFGCGAGGFLMKAKNLCRSAMGIEPEKRLRQHFTGNSLKVYEKLEQLPKNEKIDTITLFHVLEHLPGPRKVLENLSKYLSNDGQIIIEVPHANDALLALYKNEAFSLFTYWSCHLYLFTPGTLQTLAGQAGYKVKYVKQIQRYPLSNHLHWLACNAPGGHQKWSFLDSPDLHAAYEKQLASIGQCDTLIACIHK